MYNCIIDSDHSHPRVHHVYTSSAMSAARMLGRGAQGEIVTISQFKTGKTISRVRWDGENKKYIYVNI